MPKVKTTPLVAADSKTFFQGAGTPAAGPVAEPPMLAGPEDGATPALEAENKAAPPDPAVPAPQVAAAKPPLPAQVTDPFVLLYRHVAGGSNRSLRGMEVPGGVVLRTSWSVTGGFIAESSCFVPDAIIKDGKLTAPAREV
jgi:hypothetical protein